MILSNWIYSLRTDYLNSIFKIFPFFASDYFYISIIALGYWLRPWQSTFRSLAFLVPFSSLSNCLLKNIFQIPRPDIALQLTPLPDSFGFPSGDVQAATVFWGLMFLTINTSILKHVILLPIVIIGFSRMYLGVHSIWDVLGGMIFGVLTLYYWQKDGQNKIFDKGQDKNLWLLLILSSLSYTYVSLKFKWSPVVPVSIGCLIGLGLSLKQINNESIKLQPSLSYFAIAISLAMIVTMVVVIPIIKTSQLTIILSLIVKYALVTFSILRAMPYLLAKFNR